MDIELSSQVIAVKEVTGKLENPYGFNISASNLAISLPKCFQLNEDANISTSYNRCGTCAAFVLDQLTTGNRKCKICCKADDSLPTSTNAVLNDVQKMVINSISQSALQSNSNTSLHLIAIDSSLLTNDENISSFLTECFSSVSKSSDLFAIVFIDRCLRIPRLTVTESSSPIELDIFDAKDTKLMALKKLVAQGLYFDNLDRIRDMLPRLHEITAAIQSSLQIQSSSNNNTPLASDGLVQLLHVVIDTMQSAVSSAIVTVITGRTMLTSRHHELPPKVTMNALLVGQRQIDIQWIERATRRSGGMIITAETLTESHVQNTFTALLSPTIPLQNPLQSVEIELLCSEGLRLVNISGAEILQVDMTTLTEMITPIKKHYKSYKYTVQPSHSGANGLTLLVRAVRKQSNAAKFSSSARKFFNGSAFNSSASSTSYDTDDTNLLPAIVQIIMSFKGVKQGTGVSQQCLDITKVWTIPINRSTSFRPLATPNAWDARVWTWAVSQAIVSQYEEASLSSSQKSKSTSENWSGRQKRRQVYSLGIDTFMQDLSQIFMSDNRDKMRFVSNLFYGLREGPLLDGASVSLLESHLLRLNFMHNTAEVNFGMKLLRPSLKVLHLSSMQDDDSGTNLDWKEVPAECVHLLPNTITLMDAGDLIVLSFNEALESNGEWQGRGINDQSEAIQALWQRVVDETKDLSKLCIPAAKVMILPLPSTPNHRLLYSRLAPFPADSVKALVWKELMGIHGPMTLTEAAWSAVKRRTPITDQPGYAQWLLGLGLGLLLDEENGRDEQLPTGFILRPVVPMQPMERGPIVQMAVPALQYSMQPVGVVSPPPTTSVLEV